mgnify:FL=1|jgi:hypothetical protein
MLNFIRYIGYSIGAITIRKAWNWLIEDVDPDPGTKEFAKEYRKIYGKYKRMRSQYETHRKTRRISD